MDLLEGLGENAGAGPSEPLPKSMYPVKLSLVETMSSARAGTPGFKLGIVVTDGPFKGHEVNEYDSTIWMTPGAAEKGGGYIGKINHMIRAVTGEPADTTACEDHGFSFAGKDGKALQQEFATQFAGLSKDAKLKFMEKYGRSKKWDGAEVVAAIDLTWEERVDAEGNTMVDETTGEPLKRARNSVSNFYAMNDPKHGIAKVRATAFAQQEALLNG